MKKTVKLLATLLALVLAVGMFAFSASAAAADAVVLEGAAEVNPGDTYEVEVVIKAPATYTNIEFSLEFDDAKLELAKEDIVAGEALPGIAAINLKNNTVKVAGAAATATALTADGVLVTLKFDVKENIALAGDETALVSVSTAKLNNSGNKVYADGVADANLTVTVKHICDYKTKNDAESLAPDCDDPGFDRFYCACGDYKDVPVEEEGHSYANAWTPVAGQDKWFENVCSKCSDSIKTYLPDAVTNADFGATVSVDKGAFSEVVTPVIKALSDEDLAKVKEQLAKEGTVKDAYYFEVGFDSASGYNTVINAAGTKIALSLDILDALKGLDYKVAAVTINGVEVLSSKTTDNKVALALDKPVIVAVYALEEPVSSTPAKPVTPPASTGDNSVLPIAIVVMVVAVLAAGTTIVLKKKKS